MIAAALRSCPGQLGELRLGAPLWLPPRRPRSLAVELHDEGGELAAVQGDLSRAIASVSDWEPERRRFRAHVTLARIGAGVALGSRAGEPELPATPALRFTPEAVVLYRSWLSPSGTSYEPLVSSYLEPPAREPRRG
jgi:2'-5' RNA ligase